MAKRDPLYDMGGCLTRACYWSHLRNCACESVSWVELAPMQSHYSEPNVDEYLHNVVGTSHSIESNLTSRNDVHVVLTPFCTR